MSVASPEWRPWPLRRWAVFILLILTGQLTLIFWLSGKPLGVQATPFTPHVHLSVGPLAGQSGLSDPALFVLANRHGFSGSAWFQAHAVDYDLPQWSDTNRPLTLDPQRLGGALVQFVRTNATGSFQLTPPPDPPPDFALPLDNYGNPDSTLTIEGELANRRLRSAFDLISWPAADILTNTVILAGVDTQGSVFSAVLLKPSGSRDADTNALAMANAARFQPLLADAPNDRSDQSRLQWGRLIFHWHTVPLPATNTTAP